MSRARLIACVLLPFAAGYYLGTSWSLQGLWGAPWLRDVDGLDRAGVVQHLSVMAVVVCVSALLLGMVADRLRHVGIKTELLLATTLATSMLAQCALVGQWPLPSIVSWAVIAAAGAATVLSFAILGEYFPKQVSGRANAALNLLHVGGAFVLQSGLGFIIALWPQTQGTYPAEAHQAAVGTMLLLQFAALAWIAFPRRTTAPVIAHGARGSMSMSLVRQALPTVRHATVGHRAQHVLLLRKQSAHWRLAAADGNMEIVTPGATSLGLFISAALVLLLVPGPAVLYIFARSIEQGQLAGFVSILGIHTATLVHVAAAALGLSAILASSALAFSLIKYAGAAYLIWLGLRKIFGRIEAPDVAVTLARSQGPNRTPARR